MRYILFMILTCESCLVLAHRIEYFDGPIPRVLYRWINSNLLEASHPFTLAFRQNGKLPLRSLATLYAGKGYAAADYFPQLKTRSAMFFWTHPVTSMGSSKGEMYGDILLKIVISPEKARMRTLVSNSVRVQSVTGNYVTEQYSGPEDFKELNLILHRQTNYPRDVAPGNMVDEITRFQEWILLDEGLVEEVIVEPTKLTPLLKSELLRLESGVKYSDTELHSFWGNEIVSSVQSAFFNQPEFRIDFIRPRLMQYLNNFPRHRIDPVWLESSCVTSVFKKQN